MRLNNFQKQAIKETYCEVFNEGGIYLFGSKMMYRQEDWSYYCVFFNENAERYF